VGGTLVAEQQRQVPAGVNAAIIVEAVMLAGNINRESGLHAEKTALRTNVRAWQRRRSMV